MVSRWVIKRILQSVLTILIVINLSFVLVQQLPGGPMAYLQSQLRGATNPEQQMRLMQQYLNIEPNQTLTEKYISYMGSLLQGDLGRSFTLDAPVADVIASALPWTVFVMSVSISLAFLLGIVLGAIMAYKEGSLFDSVLSVSAIVTQSVPYYVFALLFVFYLGYVANIFPTGGLYDNSLSVSLSIPFVTSVLHHAALPILSIVLTWAGGYALGMRGNSIQVLGEEYLHVARLRGLSPQRIALRYVGRNAILPMYTHLVLSVGAVFGGSVVLEEIFRYRGIGFYLFTAVEARDYPLMMGTFMIISIAVVVGILVADLTYGMLDPRTGTESQRESYGGDTSMCERFARLHSAIRALPSRFAGGETEKEDDFILDTEPYERATPDRAKRLRRAIDESVVAPLKILLSDWRGRIGLAVLVGLVYLGTVGVLLVPEPVTGAPDQRFMLPFVNWQYPLGTDRVGKGLFSMTVHATPYILKMVAAGAVFATMLGALVGTVSGYVGGLIDRVLMTITDILLTLPGLPLIIVITFYFETTDPYFIGIILAVNNWTGLARSLRSQVLTLREASYVESSRTMGLATPSIVREDLLPNLMPYVSVSFVGAARKIIFEAVALYYLGVLGGISPNWGIMMSDATSSTAALYDLSMSYLILVPTAAVVLLSLGALMLSQSADRMFNPRLRSQHVTDSGSNQSTSSSGADLRTSSD